MKSRIIKNFIAAGLPFGLAMGFFFHRTYGASFGIPAGIACGLLFGISMAIFAEIQKKKMESHDNSFRDEEVLFQGPANHFRKKEGRGGWLTLTHTRLAFRTHGMNIQNTPLDISLQDVDSVEPSLTLRLIPNGLKVYTINGRKESFVVSNRRKWIEQIERAKAEAVATGQRR
jgi:hypothetical protein